MPVRTVSQKFIRPYWGKIFKGLWGRPTKTADFGSSLWQIPYPNNLCLLEDKIQNWGMYLFTISYGSYAMDQRSGAVESEELKSSRLIAGNNFPNFELLDARIASALNKIIQNTRFKKKVSLEEMKAHKEDRFLRGRQIAWLIYEYFRVTGANDSVENCADLFTVVLRNDDIQEFDSKWDGILLSMTKIPPDDILEGLYKLRIRESDKLKTVLELYDLETHQKKLGPDYHRLKTMVKRSIEQNLRMKNFEARNGNFETSAVVKNQGTKQREERSLGDCWQWKANGQCSKGDNCSFRHGMNKRAKSTQPNPSPRSSTQQSVTNASRTISPRGRSPGGKMAPQRNLHSSILWKMASSRVLVLQVRKWMQVWGKVLLYTPPGWWTAWQKVKKEWWQKCSGYVENCTTIGLRMSRYGAAEIFIDFPEELKHTEASPMCSIH